MLVSELGLRAVQREVGHMTKRSTWAVIDIETTTTTSYKRKANPFDPRNWVVLVGYKKQHDERATAVRLTQGTQDHGWLVHILANPDLKLLVGVNIKFDLLHALRHPLAYAKWQQFVARGGVVWDCQLAEYLLEGQVQSSHMLSLDELAVRYGGDLKVDEVKKLWEAGVPTEDIDPDLLLRYLIGEDLPNGERREGDIGNTERVFKAQVARARNAQQTKSILMNMGSLCATIEMERNGMYVNVPLGEQLGAELAARLAEAQQRLDQYLPPDLPFKFSWTNRYHLSPMIFGGKIKYERRQYDLKDGRQTWFSPADKPAARELFAYAQKDVVCYVMTDGTCLPKDEVDKHTDNGFLPINAEMYKSGKNAGEYKTKKIKMDDYDKPKSRMAYCDFLFPGFTTPEPEWASSTPGLYSVAEDVISDLTVRDVPFLKDLGAVKAMDKDLGTYFKRYDESKEQEVGMLTLVQPDSIIHHSLNHTSTVTGRFSSSNPNLQNIPKGNKSAVKQVFESRFGGHVLQSDFSSLEVYCQAILTACRQLIDDLKAGVDMHCMRLAVKEGMDYAEVYRLCKGWKETTASGEVIHHAHVEEWDYKRTGAKVFSFQRAYGAGAKKIASSTGMSLEDVEALIEAERKRYPEIDAYFEARTAEIKRNRRPTSRVVPHPEFPAIMCQLGISRVSTPDGKLYTYVESPAMGFMVKRGETASFSPTEIKNYEVQGLGGEWMKAAMWLAIRAFYARGNFDGLALLVNTVHDAMYADVHRDLRLQAGALLHACMLEASTFMEYHFSWKLPLPVPSDTVYGANMGEEVPFTDPSFEEAVKADRAWLRKQYMADYQPSYEKENT